MYDVHAGVAELADAQDLKSCGTYTPVPVRFRLPAVIFRKRMFKVLNVLFFLSVFTKAIFLNNIAIYEIELIFDSDILEVT